MIRSAMYLTTLAAAALGVWLILLRGAHLQAPVDVSGRWSFVADAPDREETLSAVVEQSGRYVRIAFNDGPFIEYDLKPLEGEARLTGPNDVLFFRFATDEPRRIGRFERHRTDDAGLSVEIFAAWRDTTLVSRATADGGRGHSDSNPVLTLIVQLAVIILISRVVGWLVTFVRQPRVVGEMLAGIMLGPSLLGLLFPEVGEAIFPSGSIGVLGLLAQLGVIFFLFIIGLELNLDTVRSRGRAAIMISHVSIVAPFLLGAALALFLYELLFNDTLAMRFSAVALFMGAAMSITAFPVLARILTERNLHKSNVGAVAITCAAVDDVSAWCMLAFVIGFAKAEGISDAINTTLLAATYVLVMLIVVRPFLGRIEAYSNRQGRLTTGVLAVLILVVLSSAIATEFIGIHALFGAFMAGAIMPKNGRFVSDVTSRIEPFTLVVLLPIFFAFTGLHTRIDLINSAELWLFALLIIGVACAGKFGGSTLAAAACGFGWRESSAIGILMNTRGLMELVILSIGRELGVITDAVYTMMVIMALVTTLLTTPILDWVYPDHLRRTRPVTTPTDRRHDSILIPISLPNSGAALARTADLISGPNNRQRRVVGLHLLRSDVHEAQREDTDDTDASLETLVHSAGSIGLRIEPVSFFTTHPASDIARVAADYEVGLVLMGFHRPVINASVLGGTVHRVLQETPADVAVLVDRGLPSPITTILVPYVGGVHDLLALELAAVIARNEEASLTILYVIAAGEGRKTVDNDERQRIEALVDRVFNDPSQSRRVSFKSLFDDEPINAVLRHFHLFDLVLVGIADHWGFSSHLFSWQAELIARDCPTSMLLVRRGSLGESTDPAAHSRST